jgi:hypothetical protein
MQKNENKISMPASDLLSFSFLLLVQAINVAADA